MPRRNLRFKRRKIVITTILRQMDKTGFQCVKDKNEKALISQGFFVTKFGRSDMIRTCDPCVPNAVLYQAELHSDAAKTLMVSLNCKEGQL